MSKHTLEQRLRMYLHMVLPLESNRAEGTHFETISRSHELHAQSERNGTSVKIDRYKPFYRIVVFSSYLEGFCFVINLAAVLIMYFKSLTSNLIKIKIKSNQ